MIYPVGKAVQCLSNRGLAQLFKTLYFNIHRISIKKTTRAPNAIHLLNKWTWKGKSHDSPYKIFCSQ